MKKKDQIFVIDKLEVKSTRLLSIQTMDPNLADIQKMSYKYTAAGDITRITDTKGAQNITYN